MIKKKSRFLTFIFSMLPGAGHMYMGFMKIGVSFMSVFFLLIFLSSWLHTGPLLYITPLIWFYSFFDCANRMSLEEDKFLLLEDKFLFSLDKLVQLDKNIFEERRLAVGAVLLFFGGYFLLENLLDFLQPLMPYELRKIIYVFIEQAPQIIIGIVIVAIGIKLIKGKKRELEEND